MNHTTSSSRTLAQRIHRRLVVGLIALVATAAAALGYEAENSSSSAPPPAASASKFPGGKPHGPLGEADGAVPDGTTVLGGRIPAVSRLGPELLKALQRAAEDAAGDGVILYVNSGWRSPEYQDELLRKAISEYGSESEAAQWVATPKTSPHVSGEAVDLGRSDATEWLSGHGAAYGLCQIYRNEPWHYELRPEATDQGCPRMYADPTHDPRMRK
ncbi:hypothetical protein GCM10009801_74080 [Streptomyces albiaxialis]|uniref:D-alanyl-D-alanine carboxypeptidase-like core domain-containing protein n=1 Tax=Streptomyces albiaxialis TaxID=329523 RepID=A0ABP5IL18_9ACTN